MSKFGLYRYSCPYSVYSCILFLPALIGRAQTLCDFECLKLKRCEKKLWSASGIENDTFDTWNEMEWLWFGLLNFRDTVCRSRVCPPSDWIHHSCIFLLLLTQRNCQYCITPIQTQSSHAILMANITSICDRTKYTHKDRSAIQRRKFHVK